MYMFFLLDFSHVCDVGVDPPDMEALLGWRLRFFDGYTAILGSNVLFMRISLFSTFEAK